MSSNIHNPHENEKNILSSVDREDVSQVPESKECSEQANCTIESKSESSCINITTEANTRSLSEMKKSFQPKTKLQRSLMWQYIGILKPRVLI